MSSIPNVASTIPGAEPSASDGVGGQQNVGQTYDPNVYTLVETEKLANYPDGINNLIHDAKAYQDSQSNGMGELGEYLDEKGYSPWQLRDILEKNASAPVEDQSQVPVQQAAQQQAQQVDQEPSQVPAFTMEQVLTQARSERRTEQQEADAKRTLSEGMAGETRFMGDAMDSLGLKDNPDRDWQVKPQLEALVRRNREQDIHADNPNRKSLIDAPYTRDEIATAAETLKPHLAQQASTAQEQLSDTQTSQNLPKGSLDGSGTGGRSQVPTDQMTREQKREIAEKRYEEKHGVKPM